MAHSRNRAGRQLSTQWCRRRTLGGQRQGASASSERNGDGKSSLLGLLTGQLRPDSGRSHPAWRIAGNSLAKQASQLRTVGWTLIDDQPGHLMGGQHVSGTWSPAWYPTSPGTFGLPSCWPA